MRVVVHDWAGHPFQMELSRELARRRHEVLHLHCPSYDSGKGALQRTSGDPATLCIAGVELDAPFARHSLTRRPRQEVAYGRRLAREVRAFKPEVVISANSPLLVQRRLQREAHGLGARFVFWHQDIIGFAVARRLEKLVPLLGRIAASRIVALERRLLRRSDAVIAISDDYLPILRRWGIPRSRLHLIENWAPLGELPVRPKRNIWSRARELDDKVVLLYAGTLGLKHDPELFVTLARRFARDDMVRVVVVTEGKSAEFLRSATLRLGLSNLLVLPFQPYEDMPDVLASADVLLALLQPDAGVFSVPSKVLTYLCARRPILAAIPPVNLAARTIARAEAGIVVDPSDDDGFLAAAEVLVNDARVRGCFGKNARAYAETAFDIIQIADRFEAIILPQAKLAVTIGDRGLPIAGPRERKRARVT